MKKTAVILYITSLLLYSCNQNKPSANIPVVGEAIDSSAIASDTDEQKNMESSYEYAQTIMVSPKLAYDVRAYGGPPSHGEYCIIRRGANNKPDTVVQEERRGTILNAFTADLNKNGKEEIYVVLKETGRGSASYISAFEFDKNGKATPLVFEGTDHKTTFPLDSAYLFKNVADTTFVRGEFLLRSYVNDSTGKSKMLPQAWRLIGTKIVLVPNDVD
jgi:hypothetical protein